VKNYEKKYPKKIKAYAYKPVVHPQGSKEFLDLPVDSPNSLVNYYNFALAKTTRKIVLKVDGDMKYIGKKLEKTIPRLKNEIRKSFLFFRGINLWEKEGKFYIFGNIPFCGGKDAGFFRITKRTYFVKGPHCEVLKHSLENKSLGILFYHLKFVKKDKGHDNYNFSTTQNKYYLQLYKDFINPEKTKTNFIRKIF